MAFRPCPFGPFWYVLPAFPVVLCGSVLSSPACEHLRPLPPIAVCYFITLKINFSYFYFWNTFWLTKSCKNSTKNSCIPFIQLPHILTKLHKVGSWHRCPATIILLGGPKSASGFLGKNKRHIFHFHQELDWTKYSLFCCSTAFCHFSGNFVIPSSQNFLSLWAKNCSRCLLQSSRELNFFSIKRIL